MFLFYKTLIHVAYLSYNLMFCYALYMGAREMNLNESILHNVLSIWLLIATLLILLFAFFSKKKLYYYMLLAPILLHYLITNSAIQRNGRVYDDLAECYVFVNYTWEYDIINTGFLFVFYFLLIIKINGKNIWSTLN